MAPWNGPNKSTFDDTENATSCFPTDPWSSLVVETGTDSDLADVWNDLERAADVAVDDAVGQVTRRLDLGQVACGQ